MATNLELTLTLPTAGVKGQVGALGKSLVATGKAADGAQKKTDRLATARLKDAKAAATSALATQRHAAANLSDARAADVAKRSTDRTAASNLKNARTAAQSALATDRLAASQLKNARTADASARTADRVAKAHDRQARSAKRAGSATSSLTGFLKKGLAAGAAALALYISIGGALQQFRGGVQAAVRIESVSQALLVATGSAQAGGEALAFARSEADRLGLSIGPTAGEFAKLSAAAIGTRLAGAGVRDIFSAVSEAGARLSLSADDQSGALRALGQIMSKGTVQAEELRGQLGERLPGAFQIMARGLGVTTQKLGKMLEAGEVLATTALPAFARELRKTFGTDANTRIETAAANLARFETAVFDAQVVLGNAFLPALTRVTVQVSDFLEENEDAIRTVGRWGGTALKSVVTFGTGAAKAIGVVVEGYSALLELMEAVGLLSVEQSQGGGLFGQFQELGGIAGALETTRGVVFDLIGSVVQFVGEVVGGILAVVGGGVGAIGDLVSEVARLTGSSDLRALSDILEGLGDDFEQSGIDASLSAKKTADGFRDMSEASFDAAIRISNDAQTEVEALNTVRDAALEVGSALGGFSLVPATLDIPDRLDLGTLTQGEFGPVNPLLPLGEEFQAQLQGQSDDTKKFIADLEKGREERKKVEEESLKDQMAAQQAMFDGFRTVADTLGLLDSDLGRIIGSVINALSSISRGGGGVAGAAGGAAGTAGQVAAAFGGGGDAAGGGGGASAIGAGLAAAAPVIAAFVAVFEEVSASIERKRARTFGIPISFGVSGGVGSGTAIGGVGKGGISEIEAIRAVNAMQDGIESFVQGLGGILVDLDEIGVAVRADGKEFELTVGDTVFGVFDSFEAAFSEGLRIAIGSANIEGLGPVLQEAVSRIGFGKSLDEFLELVPILREIDDVNAGLSVSYSRAKLQADQFLGSLDAESRKLLEVGVSIENVIAFREREIQAQRRQIEASGAALAGVSSNLAAFGEWAAAAQAFGDAQESEVLRQELLTNRIEADAERRKNVPTDPTSPRGGGRERGDGGGDTGGAGLPGEDPRDGVIAFSVAMSDAGDTGSEAAGQISSAFVEMIRESVAIQGELGFLQEIAAFQERFGVQVIGNQDLQQQIAELEFRSAQIRILLLVRELELNREALGLTEQQVAIWRGFASDIADLDFSEANVRRGGGGRRRELRETFRESAADIEAQLAGVSDAALSTADALQQLRDQGREARIPVEEIARAVAGLAELQLRDIAAPFAEAAQFGDESDLGGAFRVISERAQQAFAEAAALATENPAAYEIARANIQAGLDAELLELGTDALRGLGGRADLRQSARDAARDILFLVNHLDELGLTAGQVSRNVMDSVLPDLFGIIETEAQRVIGMTEEGSQERENAEAALAAATQNRLDLERVLTRIQLQGLMLQLEAAGALTASIQAMFDTAFGLLDVSEQLSANPIVITTDEGPETPSGRIIPRGSTPPPFDPQRVEVLLAEIDAQIRAWTDAVLGPVSQAAKDMSDRLQELLEPLTPGSGDQATIDRIMAAFQTGVGAFVDDALKPFEDLGKSAGQLEFEALTAQFDDLREAFDILGVSSAELARLAEAEAAAFDALWERQTEGIRAFLEELTATDPRRTSEELFTSARDRFRDLAERARGGDLDALAMLEQAARDFQSQSEAFLGGGIGSLGVRDEITGALQDVVDAGFNPTDIADPVVGAVGEGNILLADIRDRIAGSDLSAAGLRLSTAPADSSRSAFVPRGSDGASLADVSRFENRRSQEASIRAAQSTATFQSQERRSDEAMRELARQMVEQERKKAEERQRDRNRSVNTVNAKLEQGERLVAGIGKLVAMQVEVALNARISGPSAGGTGS